MSNILALDLSTKRSGFCYKINDEIKYGAVSASSTKVEERIIKQVEEICKIIKDNNIDMIIAEEVPEMGSKTNLMNNHTRKVLTWLQGEIIINAYKINKNIQYEFLEPSSWRSKIGIQKRYVKREEQKIMDIDYVNKKYKLNLTATQDDEADAICIYDAYSISKEMNNGFELK